MTYDPFSRGPFPVGVRSAELRDDSRGRKLATEIWYPAADAHIGEDLAEASQDRYRILAAAPEIPQEAVRQAQPRQGRFPLVVFSHGFGGHRRQTAHFCIHLASHGYLVASVDHTGNTTSEMLELVLRVRTGGALPHPHELMESYVAYRPTDLRFAIDWVLASPFGALVDSERIGATGHSFGGWTALMVTGQDARIRAALPLAPAGGASHLPTEPMRQALDLDWQRGVPTLYLAAEHDSLCPLEGIRELFERTRGRTRLMVLRGAEHFHFCDRVEETHELIRLAVLATAGNGSYRELRRLRPIGELCPAEHAYPYLRGLGLAHFDAHLGEVEAALAFLEQDAEAALAERGVRVDVL